MAPATLVRLPVPGRCDGHWLCCDDKFNLRGCRPLTPTAVDYKHCLYGHLKFCTAPCIGNVTREQYLQQIEAACEFLSGQCEEMGNQLESEMKKAAANQDFEKAAQLRDLLFDLRQTTRKTRQFQRLPYSLPIAIDPEKDLRELAAMLTVAESSPAHRGFRHFEYQWNFFGGLPG